MILLDVRSVLKRMSEEDTLTPELLAKMTDEELKLTAAEFQEAKMNE